MIGIPGKWSTEVLADRLEALTGHRAVLAVSEIDVQWDTGRVLWGETDLAHYDAVVVKKINAVYSAHTEDRIRMLKLLEQSGVQVISPTVSLNGLVNRLAGTQALMRAGIPMPATRITERVDAALGALNDWGQMVLKPMYSTKARGMQLLQAGQPDAAAQIQAFQQDNPVIYLQQGLELDGRDLGMVFVGGQYLCTYARVGNSEAWNTTIHDGGRYEAYTPDADLIELGRRAQQCFELGFTTVDIALTSDGPVVFEVSAFGGFKGALEGCGIDAAEAYAQHIVKRAAR